MENQVDGVSRRVEAERQVTFISPLHNSQHNRFLILQSPDQGSMSALFNFHSLLLVVLLTICTSTYVHATFPSAMDRHKNGFLSIFWKCARVGERLSPYVSLCCFVMAVSSHC